MNNKEKRKLRVKIAKDVLAQLKKQKFIAEAGTYIYVEKNLSDILNSDNEVNPLESFQKHFQQDKKTTCTVCALGSAVCSLVNVENKASVKEVATTRPWGGSKLAKRFQNIFGERMMAIMETMFEGSQIKGPRLEDWELTACTSWYENHSRKSCAVNDEKRLKLIMQNIIRNNGDIVIPRDYARSAKSYYAMV